MLYVLETLALMAGLTEVKPLSVLNNLPTTLIVDGILSDVLASGVPDRLGPV